MSAAYTRSHHPQFSWRNQVMLAHRLLSTLFLALAGCATWQAPTDVDDSSLRARAEVQQVRGVRLSASVLSKEDSQRLFGANVNEEGIQPVWIEVQNDTNQALWLLRSGADPDLFSPLEVAWSFHAPFFADETNNRLDEHFHNMSFQNPISPGTKESGIIFANPHHMTRLLSVDILGQGDIFPFSLFPPVPDDQTAEARAVLINTRQLIEEVTVEVKGSKVLRARLEQLPCCATSADGNEPGDPLNVILVGSLADVASALVRRGFRLHGLSFDRRQQFYGRPPDLVVRKKGQAGVPANWLRIWVAPFSYQGKAVFLAQAGRRQGWRLQEIEEKDLVLSPKVDEVRNLLIQDMVYSSGLEKVAFVSGVSATKPGESRSSLDASYQTDGLRAVLFLVTRPLSLSDLEILDWHPALKLLEAEIVQEKDNAGN